MSRRYLIALPLLMLGGCGQMGDSAAGPADVNPAGSSSSSGGVNADVSLVSLSVPGMT